jgi:hypothetical protein
MYHENQPADRRDFANAHAVQLRSFFVDIALYAVGMILLSLYTASLAPVALAVVLIGLVLLHAA